MEKNAYRIYQQNPAITVEDDDLFALTRLSQPAGRKDMMINGALLKAAMGGGGGGGSPGGANTQVQFNDNGVFGGSAGFTYNKVTHALTITGVFSASNFSGTSSGANTGDQDLSHLQPLDSDLTAIAALGTTAYGRALLTLIDASAGRAALGLGSLATQSGTFSGSSSGTNTGDQDLSGLQPLDSDLTAIAALGTTAFGRSLLTLVDAGAGRTALNLGTLSTQNGTFSGSSSGTNTGDQTITLTGHVTGTGTGSFATTIGNNVVTEAMQNLSDNTTNDVSTAKHGYVPKLPNDATKFLDGTGNFTTPAGGGSSPWSAGTGTGSAKGGDGTTLASGNYSVAYGSTSTTAIGVSSAAFGDGCSAGGDYSFCFGLNCQVFTSQSYCFAGGNGSQAQAHTSFAFGHNALTYGAHAIALGDGAHAGGVRSFAWGYNTIANRDGSFILACGDGNAARNNADNQFGAFFAGGFIFGMYNADFATVKIFVNIDASGNFITIGGAADQSKSVQTPTTGFSITIDKYVQRLILTPAGTLASGSITMPATPIDGQIIIISTSQIITALTLAGNTGQTMFANAPTTLAAGGAIALIYDLGTTTWLPTA